MRAPARLLALCILTWWVDVAAAQSSPAQRRVSATVGLSRGSGALTCTFCTRDGQGGVAGMLSVETSLRPAIRLAFEADWWLNSADGASRSVLAAAPVVHLYTSRSSPLFFKVGLGVGRFTASSAEEELHTTALSAVLGVGYEFRLSNRAAVIPYISYVNGTGGTIRLNGARVTPYGGLSLTQYGLAYSKR